jgi:hypothetical protein
MFDIMKGFFNKKSKKIILLFAFVDNDLFLIDRTEEFFQKL